VNGKIVHGEQVDVRRFKHQANGRGNGPQSIRGGKSATSTRAVKRPKRQALVRRSVAPAKLKKEKRIKR
jgi:hypothetical protein